MSNSDSEDEAAESSKTEAQEAEQNRREIPSGPKKFVLSVPAQSLEDLDAMCEASGKSRKDLLWSGTAYLMRTAFKKPVETRSYINEWPEEKEEPVKELEVKLKPNELMYIYDAVDHINQITMEEMETDVSPEGFLSGELEVKMKPDELMHIYDAADRANQTGIEETEMFVSTKEFLTSGVRCVSEKLEEEDIKEENREVKSRRFEKLPGQDRGGKVINIAITQEGKDLLDKRAKEVTDGALSTSQYVRQAVRRMCEWIGEASQETARGSRL
jgi:hypothetical protein